MKTSITNISSLQTGLFTKPVLNGDLVYLQSKHFDENGKLISNLHPDICYDVSISNHILHPGDILFAAKGTKNFAVAYEKKNPPAIASTTFFVIRINDKYKEFILPDYLVWWMNQRETLQYLKEQAIGTNIVSISKTVLMDLEIAIPSLERQKSILLIDNLRTREKKLNSEIEKLREVKIQSQIIKAIN